MKIQNDQVQKKQVIESIPCVNLPVSNVEWSAAWWVEHFGVAFGEALTPGATTAGLRVENGQWIFLWETKAIQNDNRYTQGPVRNSDTDQVYVMTLQVKDIDGLYEELKQSGVQVGTLRDVWAGKAFDCYDPDGNKLNVWGGEWREE